MNYINVAVKKHLTVTKKITKLLTEAPVGFFYSDPL